MSATRTPLISPPLPTGTSTCHVRQILKNFERHRPLPRHDERVIVRRDEHASALALNAPRFSLVSRIGCRPSIKVRVMPINERVVKAHVQTFAAERIHQRAAPQANTRPTG
jgi:hypothetical protein